MTTGIKHPETGLVQSSPRDPEYAAAFPYRQTAGFLTCKSSRTIVFPAFTSDCHFLTIDGTLVTHSDEIVQASHLFPYYPYSPVENGSDCFII